MKKTIGFLSLLMFGLPAFAQGVTSCEKTYVTQMKISGLSITPQESMILEGYARLGKMAQAEFEIHYGERNKAQAVLVKTWLKDHGIDKVTIAYDEDVKNSLAIYAGKCEIPAPPPRRDAGRYPARSPSWNYYEGERISDAVARWSEMPVNVTLDAKILKSGRIDAPDAQSAIEQLSRATGCSIQRNDNGYLVACPSR